MSFQTTTIGCGMVRGVDALPVTIEATAQGSSDSVPRILGLVDAAVREAYHRVFTAFCSQDLPFPQGVTTVNFVPAGVRKGGSGFDLPLALAIAGATGLFPPEAAGGLVAHGEVSLQGRVLPSPGAVAVALAARKAGWQVLLTSAADAAWAALVPGIRVYGIDTLADALFWLVGKRDLEPARPAALPPAEPAPDLADIRGHQTPKTALVVAAAGRHNLLFVGPPGSGKTALVRRLPGLLPQPNGTEALEILKIQTAARYRPVSLGGRPLRAPHHSSSTAAILGGGPDPRPGEVTLAHHGVLFLDELPEFRRDTLEALRQPLEEGRVVLGRARATVGMPADFQLVAAMNPCPCGFKGHPHRPCTCPPTSVHRYRCRISGPLLDRLDLQVEVPCLDPACFRGPPEPEWGTEALRGRVAVALDRQRRRNADGRPNGRLQDRALERAARAGDDVLRVLEEVLRRHHLSGRSRVRLLRIARTLADLDDRDRLLPEDMLEAVALRGFARDTGL